MAETEIGTLYTGYDTDEDMGGAGSRKRSRKSSKSKRSSRKTKKVSRKRSRSKKSKAQMNEDEFDDEDVDFEEEPAVSATAMMMKSKSKSKAKSNANAGSNLFGSASGSNAKNALTNYFLMSYLLGEDKPYSYKDEYGSKMYFFDKDTQGKATYFNFSNLETQSLFVYSKGKCGASGNWISVSGIIDDLKIANEMREAEKNGSGLCKYILDEIRKKYTIADGNKFFSNSANGTQPALIKSSKEHKLIFDAICGYFNEKANKIGGSLVVQVNKYLYLVALQNSSYLPMVYQHGAPKSADFKLSDKMIDGAGFSPSACNTIKVIDLGKIMKDSPIGVVVGNGHFNAYVNNPGNFLTNLLATLFGGKGEDPKLNLSNPNTLQGVKDMLSEAYKKQAEQAIAKAKDPTNAQKAEINAEKFAVMVVVVDGEGKAVEGLTTKNAVVASAFSEFTASAKDKDAIQSLVKSLVNRAKEQHDADPSDPVNKANNYLSNLNTLQQNALNQVSGEDERTVVTDGFAKEIKNAEDELAKRQAEAEKEREKKQKEEEERRKKEEEERKKAEEEKRKKEEEERKKKEEEEKKKAEEQDDVLKEIEKINTSSGDPSDKILNLLLNKIVSVITVNKYSDYDALKQAPKAESREPMLKVISVAKSTYINKFLNEKAKLFFNNAIYELEALTQ